jgi:hypothetical protein
MRRCGMFDLSQVHAGRWELVSLAKGRLYDVMMLMTFMTRVVACQDGALGLKRERVWHSGLGG